MSHHTCKGTNTQNGCTKSWSFLEVEESLQHYCLFKALLLYLKTIHLNFSGSTIIRPYTVTKHKLSEGNKKLYICNGRGNLIHLGMTLYGK